jgi:hypothetical protein
MQDLEIIPGRKISSLERAFKTPEEEDKFRREFAAAVKPELERWAEARRMSEELAIYHYVY